MDRGDGEKAGLLNPLGGDSGGNFELLLQKKGELVGLGGRKNIL